MNSLNTEFSPSEHLRNNGIYPTPQRLMIAEIILSKHRHMTADQVHEAIDFNRLKVSKATVYNTLGLFVEKHLLHEIYVDSSKTFYDSNTIAHQHFYNIDTDELIDIKKDLQPLLIQNELPSLTKLDSVEVIVKIRNQSV